MQQIIDFHTHIYPDPIAPKAVEGLKAYSGLFPKGDGTLSSLLAIGQKAGISHFVINSVATKAHQVVPINSFLAECVKSHPNCYAFGTLHPDLSQAALTEEIARIQALGLKGVKLHPDNVGVTADSEGMMRICQSLAGKLPVLMHCGDYRNDLSHPRRVAAILDAFPDLTLVAAHLGGWPIFDYALEYLEHRNCYLDISSSIMFLGPRRSKELVRIYGADRILFGSDYPIFDPAQSLAEFLSLGLTKQENQKILYDNAIRLLQNAD